jgi:hypothetical protein
MPDQNRAPLTQENSAIKLRFIKTGTDFLAIWRTTVAAVDYFLDIPDLFSNIYLTGHASYVLPPKNIETHNPLPHSLSPDCGAFL